MFLQKYTFSRKPTSKRYIFINVKDLFGCLVLILFVVLAFKTCDGCGNSSDEPVKIEKKEKVKKKRVKKQKNVEEEPQQPETTVEPVFSNDGDDVVEEDESENFDNTNE